MDTWIIEKRHFSPVAMETVQRGPLRLHTEETKIMRRQVYLVVFLAAFSSTLVGADRAETEVKGVIRQFHQALDRHDVAAIGALMSPDVVVLENGHRNDGWVDFRDNHLIPEFKEPPHPSRWEFVKV